MQVEAAQKTRVAAGQLYTPAKVAASEKVRKFGGPHGKFE